MRAKTKPMSKRRFTELKDELQAHLVNPDSKRGWKTDVCRKYRISFWSLQRILSGEMTKPPRVGNYKLNDCDSGVKCAHCNTLIGSRESFVNGDSEYCSQNCMDNSIRYRKHITKEPQPFRLERSFRQDALAVSNGGFGMEGLRPSCF